jgi:cell division protein FtsN
MTFYYTLPKGEKTPLGSGINSPRREERVATKSTAPVAAAVPVKSAQPLRPAVIGESSKVHPAKSRYCVQVASYQDRKEAELAKARLAASGFSAYIVESTVPGKGVRFRVRIGRSLDLSTATGLAAKAGKGAMVVPE